MTRAAGVPNIADRTVYVDARRKIVTALLVAFVIQTVASMKTDKAKRYDAENVTKAITSANIPAWVVITAVLMIASDFESTSRVAVGFAILLLVAVTLTDGQAALKNIDVFVNPPAPKPSTKKGP